ncbi:serine/threonine protein kinase, partial [Streptomyces beijiangensis]|nr:serine/threonine protein kinase [Streptomyces beijiangensis]
YPQPQQAQQQRPPQRQQQRPQQQRPQQRPQQQQYAPPQQPQQPQAPAPREPRQPRQRSANPMKIPGLGCLKGCLFTFLILFVGAWLIWELTPLQEWIGTTKGFFAQIGDIINQVSDFISSIGGSGSGSGSGN